ncbi:MAG: sugar phosphate isomerase/epimerase family protein [Lentisphaeria bacterium]|jgi:sugar phosphate isomerase/epimerase|nr:sugar phosphate isomerase/epimerase family protein [Lentisphaeria bacterium]
MPYVISALHFAWNTAGECLDRALGEFGLDGVELSLHANYRRPHCTEADLTWLAESAPPGAHLSAHIWENLAQLGPERGAAALRGWLPVCQRVGIRNLIIHGGSHPDQREGIRLTRQTLAAVLPEFERAGVVLNLENHYAYTYRTCQELFSEVWEFRQVLDLDSPSLRCCFDTGHGNMTKNGVELIRELAPWLAYVHLADNGGIDDDHCGFRQGTTDWDGYLAALREVGFAGTYCVEFPVRDDQAPFRQCLRELRGE